jgi:nucleoid-associated protein YgaU
MTSDAKIGLLLGLVFIVIIAFLINGLPGLLNADASGGVVSTSLAGFDNDYVGLSDKADEAVKAINAVKDVGPTRTPSVPKNYTDVRYTANLPVTSTSAVTGKNRPSRQLKSGTGIKRYTVQSGDNLAIIARKVYGQERGNKQHFVNLIYQANRKILDSPDKVSVGQKLLIPRFSAAKQNTEKKQSLPIGMFDKVRIFTGNKLSAIKTAVKRSVPAEYTVETGDSLWNIAEKLLGDGERYYEIVELNRDVIHDSEDISVGMCLKLPRR